MAEASPQWWAELERLFEQACEMPAESRAAFLERECPDEDLRREVAAILQHASKGLPTARVAIAAAAAELVRETDPDLRLIGTRLGPYKVEAIVGHGGMGTVYRASRDDAEFRQQVAIKLVRAAAATPAMLRRFRQERQILAQLSHPYIARLLDGGSTPDGIPYLVMEFIEGEPVTEWCERHAIALEQRLRMFQLICEGVQFACRHLIVHRDLKPGNILVSKEGIPKLLDFGIAKLLDPAAENQAVTQTGLQVMTPDYAAPEQVRGEPVSAATDVYALGLILYEMLTGHKAQPLAGTSPSTLASVVALSQPMPPAAIKPELAGDLDNIIRMAIRKEPARRYASPADLADDIQRYLERRPVSARPDTLGYRTAKFLRRRRAALVSGLGIAASLCLGLLLAYWFWGPTRQPHVLRVVQLTHTGRVEGADGIATDGQQLYFTERTGGHWSLAHIPLDGGTPLPVPHLEPFFQPDILDISPEGSRLLVAAEGTGADRQLFIVPTAGGAPQRIGDAMGHAGTWSPDGREIVFARGTALYQVRIDGAACRKLVETPGEVRIIRRAPPRKPDILRFSVVAPITTTVSLWEAAADGSGLHRLATGPSSARRPGEIDVYGHWTADGRYFVFQSRRGKVTSLWAMREWRSLLPGLNRLPLQIYSTALELSAMTSQQDGKRIFFAAGQERRELLRYDAARGQFLPFLPGVAGRWVDFSKDGKWVLYTTFLDDALWQSRPDGSEARRLTSMPVHQPRWSPDATRIAFSSDKSYVIPFGGETPEPIADGMGGEPSWSADGKRLLLQQMEYPGASGKAGFYIIDSVTRNSEFVPGSESLSRPAWSPDSRYIAANHEGTEIHLFDFKRQKWTLMATGRGLGVPFWSRDSQYIYYQDAFGGAEQPIFRVHIRSRKIERMMTSRQIPQANVTGFVLAGMAPDDMPVITAVRSNSDLYALEVDLP